MTKHVAQPASGPGPAPTSLPPLVSISQADASSCLCVLSLRLSFADAYRVAEAIAAKAGELMALWEGTGVSTETYHVQDARRLAHLADQIRQVHLDFMRSGAQEVHS